MSEVQLRLPLKDRGQVSVHTIHQDPESEQDEKDCEGHFEENPPLPLSEPARQPRAQVGRNKPVPHNGEQEHQQDEARDCVEHIRRPSARRL